MLAFNGSVGTYQLVGLLVSVIIPILVDLVTKQVASPQVKAITLAALSALNGFGVELLQSMNTNTTFHLDQALLNAFTAFIIATATFFGLWRPVGVSGSTGTVQTKVSGGIGGPKDEAGFADIGGAIAGLGLLLIILALFLPIPIWIGIVLLIVGVVLMVVNRSRV